ncbi:MAG: SRPBCC family protein, partial [Myxococcales bacterium]|nr:SRPBCC family protein [Myxococcales bacterium]
SERLEGRTEVRADIETVFGVVDDPEKSVEWLPGMLSVSDIKGEGRGRTYNWRYKMAAFKLSGKSEITAHDPPKRVIVQSSGGADSTWTWEFEEKNGKTVVSLVVVYVVPIPLLGRIAERLLVRQNAKEMNQALENVKRMSEAA